jgi:predicted RNA binding protein YcfA (HicA-like mRNA interferase family)
MQIGFRPIRQSGSHVILINKNGIRTVIPVHPGKDIKPALVSTIIKEVGLEREEFLKLLESV